MRARRGNPARAILESLGYDDVIVHQTDPANPIPGTGYMVDLTTEEREEIRSVMPKDPRPPATAS